MYSSTTEIVPGVFDIQIENESDADWLEFEAFRVVAEPEGLRETDLSVSYAFLRIPNLDPEYCENIFIESDGKVDWQQLPEWVRIAFDRVVELATLTQYTQEGWPIPEDITVKDN